MTLRPIHPNAAPKLAGWFRELRDRLDATVFGVASGEALRGAAAMTSLTHHVASFQEAATQPVLELRESVWILAAATRHLGLPAPEEAQWASAAANVNALDVQLETLGASPWVGESAAEIFREHFMEALRHAGVARVSTILDAANRRTALALAVNWGMRFIVATAASLVGVDVDDPAAREVVDVVASR